MNYILHLTGNIITAAALLGIAVKLTLHYILHQSASVLSLSALNMHWGIQSLYHL